MDIASSLIALTYFNLCINLCSGYKTYKLQGYDLCASKPIKRIIDILTNGPEIMLEEGKSSAARIDQTWNSTTLSVMRHNCTFRVRSPKRPRAGIYLAIDKMKLRKDNLGTGCMDYVQFSSGRRSPSRRICGEISRPKDYYFEEREEVKVNVYINRSQIIQDELKLSMVFTAHSDCNNINGFLCDPYDYSSCISKHFVHDNVKNCPPTECRDEDGCDHEITAQEVGMDTSNIALSAITSLIFTMVAVGVCLWICWKYRECCQNSENASRPQAEDVPTIELPTSPISPVNEINQRPPSPKDLPPSYESLFPER